MYLSLLNKLLNRGPLFGRGKQRTRPDLLPRNMTEQTQEVAALSPTLQPALITPKP